MFKKLERELQALQRTSAISIPLAVDERGYLDKECPAPGCEFLFKVNKEDWLNICRDEAVWCPLCGHSAPAKQWYTKQQVEHAKREALKQGQGRINTAVRADAQAFNLRQPMNSFVSMSMRTSGGSLSHFKIPAAALEAMQLEIQCEACTTRFAVIGSAYFVRHAATIRCTACSRIRFAKSTLRRTTLS